HFALALLELVEHREQELILGTEVIEQSGVRYRAAFGQSLHRQSVVAVLAEHADRLVEYRCPARLDLGLALRFGHAIPRATGSRATGSGSPTTRHVVSKIMLARCLAS